MASIILSSVGSIAGASLGSMAGIGSALGASIGQLAGSFAGSFIDQNLFGSKQNINTYGKRLSDLAVQSSVYGEMINILFGSALIAGNIIWATDIKEASHIRRQTGGGKGMKIKQTHTDYSYSISLAIALCEGTISSINKVIADGRVLDPTLYNMRVYRGDEAQLPDPLIESIQGIGKTPAYRGIAYVVFENLELAEFGNRIPNFNFEVRKEISSSGEVERVEDLIESIIIIPGCGEFVYDTNTQQKLDVDYYDGGWIQRGMRQSINRNNLSGKADAVLALDQLKETLPNVKWVAPVVSWFASSLDINNAIIEPRVEYKANVLTTPSVWKVAGFTRETARLITQKERRPIYGGTTNDESISRYLDEMKSRGFKVMFYPMVFVDQEDKPWRGHISGEAKDVKSFFNKKRGYNEFILHYARLVKGKVDAFIIGSELKNLTSVKTKDNNFPTVEELINLAAKVKVILGEEVKVSYAADWSEYHHSDEGWHHLDDLWASPHIDFIGIDAYFPLSNEKHSVYDVEKLMKGWESGEGYDFYYLDSAKKEGKAGLSPEWAWKNIKYWWENEHHNPNGKKTSWVPKSKKIWFTEYGFPSITCASNQPNVFYDPSTSESNVPIHSDASIDLFAQRAAIEATEKKWRNSDMIENKFLWTWDARPYPYWPNLNDVWADGACWVRGHWVQGKLGISTLAQVIMELLQRTALKQSDIDLSKLNHPIEGFCITSPSNLRNMIKILQQAYFFDIVEQNRRLTFMPRIHKEICKINSDDLVATKVSRDNIETIHIKRVQEMELPQFININFFNSYRDFQVSTVHAQRYHTSSQEQLTINLPIVMTEHIARRIADIALFGSWLEQMQYTFTLSLKYAFLKPGNLVEIEVNNEKHLIRITNTCFGKNRVLKVEGVAENLDLYDTRPDMDISGINSVDNRIAETYLEILDIPLLGEEKTNQTGRVLFAACPLSSNWSGCTVYLNFNTQEYKEICRVKRAATMGAILNTLNNAAIPGVIDLESSVTVNIISGSLKSISFDELINYGNLAVINNEIIQFQNAELLSENQYKLSKFLRGRFGTEKEIGNHNSGDRFILLDESLEYVEIPNQYIGKTALYKAISFGELENKEVELKEITYQATCLKPYSPCYLHVVKEADNLKTLKWLRRTRGDGELRDNVDVVLNEDKEEYLVRVTNNEVIKEIITHIPELKIDLEIIKILKEKGAMIKISQLSQKVGEGNEVSVPSELIRRLTL
ncbi:hypothetical protein NF27_HQ00210 [Candidatus Jidaibacter acanthamoeba]|uniref:Uncharacterized protein n=1 Tax=Candidatus Jidaibacter acanthamoebae TaxID=86105 RepID=A0A0C1QK17_9RICK|nr:glycoside hydrolase TIM-barrel-like domain-containing protein [Candidatus Jidaibacter acanthamoeba]KIE04483.1 hypothetical protein NF27_HQ00210 [Candidatus Jidaibacter acanthamoeba]